MKNKIFNLVAKFTAIATILASIMTVSPASAAAATNMKDTMSRLKASVTGVTHVVTMTLPAGTTNGDLTLTYPAGFANFAFTSGTCSPSGGTVTNNGTATNVVNVTLTGCAAADTLTINFTGDNSASTGSQTVSVAGTSTVTGQYAVTIVSDDQVSVTATVDPSITFNVGAQAPLAVTCDGTFSGNGGTVALGILTTGAVTSSDVSGVDHICTRVSTNASGGVTVTVKSANASLKSTSVATDLIPSATAAMAAGTANYGLCASDTVTGLDTTTPSGNAPTRQAPFNGSCAADTAAGSVGALTTSAQNVWTTAGVVANGFYNLVLKAAISGTTAAHNDYTDTLTFVATATF